MTSRRAVWPAALGMRVHALDVLAPQESSVLLRQLADHLTDHEATRIAHELGEFPLALYLAGSFLARYPTLAITTYLRDLQQQTVHHQSLQGRGGIVLPTSHDAHVARTFGVSLARLSPTLPVDVLALTALTHIAVLAPGVAVPIDLVLALLHRSSDDLDGHDALLRLAELGLLVRRPRTVWTHRLVHAAVHVIPDTAQATREQDVATYAAALAATDQPYVLNPLLPHLRWLTRAASDRHDAPMAALCEMAGLAMRAAGDYAAAQAITDQAIRIATQVHGAADPATLRMRKQRAQILHALGDYTAAMTLWTDLIAHDAAVVGADHPETARSMSRLAHLLHASGDPGAARVWLDRALAIQCQVGAGASALDRAQSLNQRGGIAQVEGDAMTALTVYRQALAIQELELGGDHPTTADTMNNLASVYASLGDHTAAQALAVRVLTIHEQVFGPDHPTTAQSLNNLAVIAASQGAWVQARPLYERALAIYERVSGPLHPSTARTLANLGDLYCYDGDRTAARACYERALMIRETCLGTTHFVTATSLDRLGDFLRVEGDYSAARPFLDRALVIREAIHGVLHPLTAQTLEHLGAWHQAVGDCGQARACYARSLQIVEATLAHDHARIQALRAALQDGDAP